MDDDKVRDLIHQVVMASVVYYEADLEQNDDGLVIGGLLDRCWELGKHLIKGREVEEDSVGA